MTTITPEQLNLLSLPSIPLEERKGLPACSGIYFAIDSAGEIQYIGRSNNIRQRWSQHHRYSQLEALGSVQVAWLQVSDSLLLPSIEAALIEYFHPCLNSQVFAPDSDRNSNQLTIRVKEEIKKEFILKAKANGTNATELLVTYMKQYLGK